MVAFATLLAVGSTALTTVGTIAKGQTEAQAMDANAAALREKGKQERAAGSIRAERRYRDAERLASLQQAEFARSGGGVGGSAGHVMGETGRQGWLNSNLEVWQGEQRGRGFDDEAALQTWGARRRRAAIPIEAGAALLSGTAKAFGGYGSPTSASSDVVDDFTQDGWRTTTRRNSGLYYG
jgi:hypothetical protein